MYVAPASDEGREAMKAFQLAKDLEIALVAAEPDLCNGVAFAMATWLVEGLMVGRPEPAPNCPSRVGLLLIAPGVHYPLHTHAADEVYYVVSGEIGIRHGTANEPLRISAPGYRITPPSRVPPRVPAAATISPICCF